MTGIGDMSDPADDRVLGRCPDCRGTGVDPSPIDRVPCPLCDGSGEALVAAVDLELLPLLEDSDRSIVLGEWPEAFELAGLLDDLDPPVLYLVRNERRLGVLPEWVRTAGRCPGEPRLAAAAMSGDWRGRLRGRRFSRVVVNPDAPTLTPDAVAFLLARVSS